MAAVPAVDGRQFLHFGRDLSKVRARIGKIIQLSVITIFFSVSTRRSSGVCMENHAVDQRIYHRLADSARYQEVTIAGNFLHRVACQSLVERNGRSTYRYDGFFNGCFYIDCSLNIARTPGHFSLKLAGSSLYFFNSSYRSARYLPASLAAWLTLPPVNSIS